MEAIDKIKKLLEDYREWLYNKTYIREIDKDWIEITTPYLDRHNDYIQIYTRKQDNGYIIIDDGYIIEDLQQSGCNLETPKRKMLLTQTLNGFEVKNEDGILQVDADIDNFAMKKHSLIQAMLAINNLFCFVSSMEEFRSCEWKYDSYHHKWDTECGTAYQFMEGGRKDNDYRYCPYCGGRICCKDES